MYTQASVLAELGKTATRKICWYIKITGFAPLLLITINFMLFRKNTEHNVLIFLPLLIILLNLIHPNMIRLQHILLWFLRLPDLGEIDGHTHATTSTNFLFSVTVSTSLWMKPLKVPRVVKVHRLDELAVHSTKLSKRVLLLWQQVANL